MYLNIFSSDVAVYLKYLNEPDVTELALNEYHSATNMTWQLPW